MVITNDLTNKIKVTVSLQKKDGKYYAVMQYKDQNGKQQYKWRATKQKVEKGNKRNAQRIAEQIRQQFETELNTPTSIVADKSNILFGDYMSEWLDKQESQVELTTFAGYSYNVKEISKYFNEIGLKLNELKTKHIQQFYDYLQETKHLKYNTVKRYHANIHKSLEDAIRLELINTNPASHIKHKKEEQYIAEYYNEAELKQLFDAIKGDIIQPIVLVTAYYGLRKEEVLGLKTDAIDFVNKTITIKHTVTGTSVKGKRVIVKKDRTKCKSSYRTLPLIPEIEELLLKQKVEQENNKKFFGNSYNNKDNYIFTDEQGNIINPDRVSRRFKAILEKNNLKKIRFHDLRHSCATLLLQKGITLGEIQKWLGHSTIKTTEIYANNEVLDKTMSADTIAKALKRSA